MTKFPVVIFAYNRPKHLYNLIKSLEQNKNINDYEIFLFCDGFKNKKDLKEINKIRIIANQSSLNFSNLNFRKKNVGLANNVISGISEVLKKNKACIVFEDDLVVAKSGVNFLNYFLNKYQNSSNLGSISLYSYIDHFDQFKEYKYYLSKRHCSWGWGTWAHIWNDIEWEKIDYDSHFLNLENKQKFSLAGNDLNTLLWGQYNKYINSWAIRFNYHCFLNNFSSFQSRFSLVDNNGQDGSGTHETFSLRSKNLKNKEVLSFSENLDHEKYLISSKNIDDYIMKSHRRSIRLSVFYFLKNFSFL